MIPAKPLCLITAGVILTSFTLKVSAADFCEQYAEGVISSLATTTSFFVKIPESTLARLARETDEIRDARCASNASMAYASLRLAELGAGQNTPIGLLSPERRAELRTRAAQLSESFPSSVQIATIYARLEASPDAARKALSIDPGYPPAHAALAAALLETDQAAEAEAALSQIKDISRLSDGYALLARIRLALGNTAGAIASARKGLAELRSSHLEPNGSSWLPFWQLHEVLGLAYLKQEKYSLAAKSLQAAEPGSEKAAALLRTPPAALQRELRKLPPFGSY